MQTEQNAKQQIVEKIKNSTNILVTVGKNPSVDALSAALSLTLMLNRLDKHATAVFSGQIPPAIGFLEPNKTFENTVDSLRDFIIALDKEKADRLRYKVEDDVVRIFITPYRTVLSEADLQFSQGDFNVELIIALGVEQREDLDTAITAHGRILHDATVMTINTTAGETTLGSVDWMDTSASSLCEMLMSLSEALQSGLLDQQIATAVLTGIVASTDRFRNEHTSPKVMTMAAQLMAAGANQQLIAAKLEEGHVLPDPHVDQPSSDGTVALAEGQSEKLTSKAEADPVKEDGSLEITHSPQSDITPIPDPASEALIEAEKELAQSLQTAAPTAPTISVSELQRDLNAASQELDVASGIEKMDAAHEQDSQPIDSAAPAEEPLPALRPEQPPKIKKEHRTWRAEPTAEPAFGGTLSATTSDAEEQSRQEEMSNRNKELLSHDGEGDSDSAATPSFEMPAPLSPIAHPESEAVQPEPLVSTSDSALNFEPTPLTDGAPTLADLDAQTRGQAAEDARAAVDAALSAMPFNPAGNPLESAGASSALELNHADVPQLPVSEPVVQPPVAVPEASAPPAVAPPAMSLPPLPDFSTLPPLPGEQSVPATPSMSPVPSDPALDLSQAPPIVAPPTDPGQFKIPGQS